MTGAEENARRVSAMQTIEGVKGQMVVLQGILDDIQAVLSSRSAEDRMAAPIAPGQIGALIRELETLRMRLERLAEPGNAPGEANW
jgi:hypothetical protein